MVPDDFFSKNGQFVNHTDTKTNNIYVQTDKGNVLLTQVPLNSQQNRQIVAAVVGHFAKEVGIKTINQGGSGITGLKANPKGTSSESNMAFTEGNDIFLNKEGNKINSKLSDANNLKSTLFHEEDHKNKGQGFTDISNADHAQVYLDQVSDATFKNTTAGYKNGIIGSATNFIKNAAYDDVQNTGNFDDVNKLVSGFNKLSSTTGYSITLTMTKNGGSNPDGYQFDVNVTPVKTKSQ